jgi:hypothetical protein
MVKVKYSALYTDNLGCEQAELCFLKGGLQLKVRNCIFYDNDFDFDFYAKDSKDIGRFFYLKDNELIEYVMDVKIPLILTHNDKECVKQAILCIKRYKNSYSNSLSLDLNGKFYVVEGYNLQDLLSRMKERLPEEYMMECNFSCMLGVYYIEADKENNSYCLKNFEEEYNNTSNKDLYLKLSNVDNKKNFKGLQKLPITYIYNEYCSS